MHQFSSGTASQATPHGRCPGGIFVSQWPPICSPLDPRAGGGASASETRAASEVPGFEPGRAVTRTSDMTTVPLRPPPHHLASGPAPRCLPSRPRAAAAASPESCVSWRLRVGACGPLAPPPAPHPPDDGGGVPGIARRRRGSQSPLTSTHVSLSVSVCPRASIRVCVHVCVCVCVRVRACVRASVHVSALETGDESRGTRREGGKGARPHVE